jgi:hypothetical protein
LNFRHNRSTLILKDRIKWQPFSLPELMGNYTCSHPRTRGFWGAPSAATSPPSEPRSVILGWRNRS